MGLFDIVKFWCPRCQEKIEVQSKAGDCELHEYFSAAPASIAGDLNGEYVYCEGCNTTWQITTPVTTDNIPLFLTRTW